MIEFKSINFKLIVLNELRTLGYFKSDFDNLLNTYWDEKNFTYEPIKEIFDFCKNVTLTQKLLNEIKSLEFDGGNEIYQDIIPNWDGEDTQFDIDTIEDVIHLKNLESFRVASMSSTKDFSPLLKLKKIKKVFCLDFDEDFIKLLHKKNIDTSGTIDFIPLEEGEDENDFFTHYNIGLKCYEEDDEYETAITHFNKAIDIEPSHLPFYYIALCYNELGDQHNALLYFDKAIEVNSNYRRCMNSRAFLLYEMGRYNEALIGINKALDGYEEFDLAQATKAEILFALNDMEIFFITLKKAVKLGINPEILDEKIAKALKNDKRYKSICSNK